MGTDAAREPAGSSTDGTGALMRLLEGGEARRTTRSAFRVPPGLVAGGVALLLGAGFVGGAQILGGRPAATASVAQITPAPADPNAQVIRKLEDEVHTLRVSLDALRSTSDNARQDEAIRGLKKSIETLRQDLDVAKASSSGAVAQLGSKVEKIDRDPGPKLAELAARVDKLDRADKDGSPKLAELAQRVDQLKPEGGKEKLADLTARLDRLERSVTSSTPTGSIAPRSVPVPVAAPSQPVATPEPKPPLRQNATLDGWLLRDVYGGVALVEGRSGLREVAPGQVVPGIGEVRSIEKHGRSWVVVTSRGVIEADNRW